MYNHKLLPTFSKVCALPTSHVRSLYICKCPGLTIVTHRPHDTTTAIGDRFIELLKRHKSNVMSRISAFLLPLLLSQTFIRNGVYIVFVTVQQIIVNLGHREFFLQFNIMSRIIRH
jgi:hypothetical protein